MTFLLDEDSVAVKPDRDEESHREGMAVASRALLVALWAGRADVWPCGHKRLPENTQFVGPVSRCRTCRRARWNRGFRIVLIRRQARVAALRVAQRKASEIRCEFNAKALAGAAGKIPAADLIAETAQAFGMTPDNVTGRKRARRYIDARATVVMILRERGLSAALVGRLLGGRDHSTIVNSGNNFDIYSRRNPTVLRTYALLRDGRA